MAETQRDKAGCVVLSGTGADGSAGIRVIKELGGICAVQSPEEARYDGMPHSALATKLVDFTLPADQLVSRLKQYYDGTFQPDLSGDPDRVLLEIFDVLGKRFGHDFSGYKRSTLVRRLNRRMQVLEIVDVDHYLARLKQDDREKEILLQDFLINVTAFFRDREEFEALRQKVLLPMIDASDGADEIRIWVPGCSSGQEAYSLAMVIDEVCDELEKRPLVQIFATDIDEAMIGQARRGVYPVSVFAELPAKYQKSYTVGLDGKFEIVKRIRSMVRFSVHNLIQDPPFSKIDLISCRNLLIYLGEQLQNDVLPLMHFSLKPGGYLFLGTSENVTRRGALFSAVDQRSRIFRRQNTAKRLHIQLPLGHGGGSAGRGRMSTKMAQEIDFPRHQSLDSSNAAIYEIYSPPFVRIASDGRIIDSSGDLSLFLASRPGEDRNLQSLARDSVRDVVIPLVTDAVAEDRRRAIKNVEVHSPFGVKKTDIIAHPMKDETVTVLFVVKDRLDPVVDEYAVAPHTRDRRVADLQEELQETRLLLKSKVEEIETANEELKSSNEEMMSMNEELQSANEELTTANEELKNKIDELTLANADLDNFVQSAEIAMIVLDRAMRIRHVTDAAHKIVPILHSDKGRLMSEFNLDFAGLNLLSSISKVLETAEPVTKATDVDAHGRAYFVQVMPYFFNDNSVEGATVTILDITEETRLRKSLEIESQRLKLALLAGRMGLAEIDIESGEVDVDKVLAQQFGLDDGGLLTIDAMLAHVGPEDVTEIKKALDIATKQGADFEVDFAVNPPHEPTRWVRTRGTPYTAADGRPKIVGPTIDITAIQHQDLILREMSHRVKNLFAVIAALVQLVPKEEAETQRFADDLLKRIVSLGDAYDLARKTNSLSGVRLGELLERLIASHLTGQNLALDGPEVIVNSDSLNTLTLLLHELTTNAIKHGALSDAGGGLDISWFQADDGLVHLKWSETVLNFKSAEAEEGFGSKLIDRGVKQLNGSFEKALGTHGYSFELALEIVENPDP
ncbi:MAG: PAS domain-containing protein [Litoreibacter sp.]|nr:PAS domain-containing protein [Litoreibacter sp.]